MESGWEKVQRSLGLPVSLYHKPAENGLLSLISIDNVKKYETDDEIRKSAKLAWDITMMIESCTNDIYLYLIDQEDKVQNPQIIEYMNIHKCV